MVGMDFEMPSCCTNSSFVHCPFYDICRHRETIRANYKPNDCPLVEAIPKANIQKALKEASKDISENVLAIVREEYISKADYEARLKADMVAMLEEIQMEVMELPVHVVSNIGSIIHMEIAPSAEDVYELIQQKIDKLRGENNG